jgi:hypothetical protein
MNFGKFFSALGPVIGVALAASLSGCDGAAVTLDGEKGKPLAELDLTGAPPQSLTLLGPDTVRVTSGDKLAITVDGDAETASKLRFTLKDGALGIMRDGKSWSGSGEPVVVNVTMPAPRAVTMAGSGRIDAAALAGEAEVTVAGSGEVAVASQAGESLDLTLAGSGNYRGAGQIRKLDLTIAGSGSALMEALRVEQADLSIAGSGNAVFASDGEVEASIMGSGSVTVRGRARCKVSAMGSGRLVCENGTVDAASSEPPQPPDPPEPQTP